MLGPKHEDGVLDRLQRRVGTTMWAAAAIHKSFRTRLIVSIDPAVGRWTRDPVRATQVRYRHLFFLITRQKLQTLIQDSTLFPGHTTSSCLPKAEVPSPSRFAVNHVSGLFCNGSAKYAQAPPRSRGTRGFPQSSALRLCRPPLRYALSVPAALPLQGWEIPSPCTL